MSEPVQAPTLNEGRYTLTRQIGEGGMAAVFLGWDNKLKVWRAVKVLLPAVVRKRKLRKRFENEAHAMARVEHPNVVRVYDVGLEGHVPYMVMELAEGGCVVDWLARFGAMPPRLAVDVTVQVCKGIRAAHEAGIVHRDIKPHNILVNRKGNCKVTDFGIAQMDSESLTKTGSVMGTWGYMAPEQRSNAKAVDTKADVFSVGATLYSLLTNKTPTELYVADEDDEIFEGIPPELLQVILKACKYKPSERYPDVGSLGMAVHKAGSSQPKVPASTPSLILKTDPLPESVESAPLSPTIVSEIQAALGVQRTTLPEEEPPAPPANDTSATPPPPSPSDKRVLPYYMPFEPKEEFKEVVQTPRHNNPNIPSYIDEDEFKKPDRSDGWKSTPVPTASHTLTAPPVSASSSDWLAWIAAVPVVLLVVAIGLVGWGMVQVNGVHDITNEKSQALFIAMQQQGPVVDAVSRGEASRNDLSSLYFAYEGAEGHEKQSAAKAYITAIEAASEGISPEARGPVAPALDQLSNTLEAYETAREEWKATAESFPGSLAVAVGLAGAP